MVNLKQASFKPLKLTGLARCMPESEDGRVTSAVWLGVARTIMDREVSLDSSIAITKHTPDMKFMEASSWSVEFYTLFLLLKSFLSATQHSMKKYKRLIF